MKKIIIVVLLMILFAHFTKAQYKKMLSTQISINQIELGFQHSLLLEKLWANAYIGIGNQDINHNFDDFTFGFRLGYDALSYKKNQLAIVSGFELYFPNNDYYSTTIPIINAGVRYTRFFGKKEKHCLLLSLGYKYGKRDYKEEYSSDIATISSIGTFKTSPLYFSIGYGFKF